MVKKEMQGVNGVLQELISEERMEATNQHGRIKARAGRPLSARSHSLKREKVTFTIRPDLIDSYRDWSWDARTSVSSLVEAALADFRRSRKR